MSGLGRDITPLPDLAVWAGGLAGPFAGGEIVPSERTVTAGVRHGKGSAREIAAWLEADRPAKPALAAFEMLVHAHA